MKNEETLKKVLSILIAFFIVFGSFIWLVAVSMIPLFDQLSREWIMIVGIALGYSAFFGWFVTIATNALRKELR